MDIVFVIDGSHYLTSTQFDDQITFFKTLASDISVGKDEAKIGVVIARGISKVGRTIGFKKAMTSQAVIQILGSLRYTNIKSQYHTRHAVFRAVSMITKYGRKDAQGVIVTVTADTYLWYRIGKRTNIKSRAGRSGIKLIGVGLNLENVDPIVTDQTFAFLVEDSGDIPKQGPAVLSIVCKYTKVQQTLRYVYNV